VGGNAANTTVTISGGGGGISTVLSPTVRYQAFEQTISGVVVASQILSTGTLYAGLSWSQSGTTVTITSTAHGLTNGDYIVVRGGADSYLYVLITYVDVDTFTYTSATTATTTGTDGAYVPAFKLSSVTKTTVTIDEPSSGNVQLLSMTFSTEQTGQPFITVTVPNTIENGAGGNTDLFDKNNPVVSNSINGATSTGAAVSFSTTSNFNQFKVEGINAGVRNSIKMVF